MTTDQFIAIATILGGLEFYLWIHSIIIIFKLVTKRISNTSTYQKAVLIAGFGTVVGTILNPY